MKKKPYWENRELVVIGTFAALIKIVSSLVSLAGGGMNPVSLIMKNLIATALLVVLVFHVRKFGVVMLYVAISSLVSIVTLGSGLMIAPGMIVAGVLTDVFIVLAGGYTSAWAVMLGIAFFDLAFRAISLGIGFLFMREAPQLIVFAALAVGIGYLGCLAGLFVGRSFVAELRHAGVIRH